MSSAAALLNRVLESRHHDEFMAFATDPATREVLAELAEKRGWPATTVQEGGITMAIQLLVTAPSPHRLIVDLADSPDPVTAVRMLRDACGPETVIIALGTVNDIELLRDLGRAGAADYLVKPVTWETLDETIEKAVREAGGAPGPSAGEQKLGRIVVFVGSRGGAGASTLAMNCAWLMAHEQELRVALVDLDLQFGTLALNLDIEPSHGLVEALQNPSRIDGLFIASAMVNASDNLFVLAGEEPIDVATTFNAEAIDLLFDEMRETFDCIVVDLPRGNLVQSRALLAKAAEVGVVCDLSLPCVRDTMRVLSFLKEAAGDANVSVIANRVRRGAKGQISKRDFERGIETGIDFVIPDDAKAATASANAGKPLPAVAKRSGIVQALRKLELRLSGLSEPKRGILFGKRGTA
jgi:pilus assembly protein CpaE